MEKIKITQEVTRVVTHEATFELSEKELNGYKVQGVLPERIINRLNYLDIESDEYGSVEGVRNIATLIGENYTSTRVITTP